MHVVCTVNEEPTLMVGIFTSRRIFELYVIFLIVFCKSYGNSTHIDLQLVLFIQLYIKLKTTPDDF